MSPEEQESLILRATCEVERLCAALRDSAEMDEEGLKWLALGIVVRIGALNSVIMTAAGVSTAKVTEVREKLSGSFLISPAG